jgi:hypothetical protein
LSKKIQFHLLPADLAFQLAYPFESCAQLRGRALGLRRYLARPTGIAQSFNTARLHAITPFVQHGAPKPEFSRKRTHVRTGQHPANDSLLELSTETTTRRGHELSIEICP